MCCSPNRFYTEKNVLSSYYFRLPCAKRMRYHATLFGKGKNICWKLFIKYASLLTGVVRGKNIKDPQKKYRLGTVSKIVYTAYIHIHGRK